VLNFAFALSSNTRKALNHFSHLGKQAFGQIRLLRLGYVAHPAIEDAAISGGDLWVARSQNQEQAKLR
jgi:hypothetical protein